MTANNLVTPQDIVTFSLKAAGVLGVGQTALAEDNSDTFAALNAMIGVWNRRRWLIYHLIDTAVVSTGAMSYTVGPGGSFNIPRPPRLEAAFFRQIVNAGQSSGSNPFSPAFNPQFGPSGSSTNSGTNVVDYPLEILQSREDYNQIALKSLISWPTYIFYDASFPMGNVFPWPVPQASIYSLHITTMETIRTFNSFSQTINLPPEYFETLWTNLTIRLGAIYPGASVTDDTRALAKASLATIESANTQIPRLRMPGGFSRPALYNIFSDQTY